MNHSVHYFHDLISTASKQCHGLQLDHIYVNKRPCLYMHKKLAQKFPGLLIPH